MVQAADLDGESSSGQSGALRVKASVGLPQAGRFQDVATLPVDEEAPSIEVHLVAWCLEVQGHCGYSRVRTGALVALSSLHGFRGLTLPSPPDRPVGKGLSSSLQRAKGPTVWVMLPSHHGLGRGGHGSQEIQTALSLDIPLGRSGGAGWDMEKPLPSGPGLGQSQSQSQGLRGLGFPCLPPRGPHALPLAWDCPAPCHIPSPSVWDCQGAVCMRVSGGGFNFYLHKKCETFTLSKTNEPGLFPHVPC